MTRSIREILAAVPGKTYADGQPREQLDDYQLASYLQAHCNAGGTNGPAAKRANRHAIRDAFYRDGGCEFMETVVNKHFEHSEVREWRVAWIRHAHFSNPVKRIVRDVSTVYDEPSVRRVGGDDTNEAKYRALVDGLMLDEQMAEVERLVNLHRVILVGPRVRQNPDDSWSMVLDIATPAVFRPVLHPTDGTLVVGWLIGCEARVRPDLQSVRVAAWELWTDHEMFFLDSDFRPLGEANKSGVEHGFGVNRWMPMSLHAVALPGFWPGEEGEDLIAAAVAIWFAGILLMKETQSATKLTTQSGNTGSSPRDQPLDTGVVNQVPDGVVQTTTDMSMDTSIFITAADHILERVANGYGMSLAQLRGGFASAEARDLALEPLRALRRSHIKYARRWEKQLAVRMAKVGAKSGVSDLTFTVDAWWQDFGEIQALTPFKQRMEEHIQARQIGLDNRIRFIQRENPDLDAEQAAEFFAENIAIETKCVGLMKALMAISGGRIANPTTPTGDPPMSDSGNAPPTEPFVADDPNLASDPTTVSPPGPVAERRAAQAA